MGIEIFTAHSIEAVQAMRLDTPHISKLADVSRLGEDKMIILGD